MNSHNPPADLTPDELEFLELFDVDGLSEAERRQFVGWLVGRLRA